MDQRRLLLFLVLSIAIFRGWLFLTARNRPAAPKPVAKKQVEEPVPEAKRPDEAEELADRAHPAEKPEDGTGAAEGDEQQPDEKAAPQIAEKDAQGDEQPAQEEKPAEAKSTAFPLRTVELGSLDPKTGTASL